jgi:hypothetical protein
VVELATELGAEVVLELAAVEAADTDVGAAVDGC